MRKVLPLALSALFAAAPAGAENVNLEVVNRIKQEAFLHSRVMDYVHLIADENGPRMAGSPGFRRAADKAVAAYRAAGIERAEVESWGTFGRGWDWSRVAVQMKTPQETTLVAYPADYSPATDGPVSGEVVFAPLWEEEFQEPPNGDLEALARRIEAWQDQWRGKLRDKVVMWQHPKPFALPDKPETFRLSDEDLTGEWITGYNQPLQPGPVPELHWPVWEYPIDKDERSRVWDVIPLEYAADRWRLDARITGRIHGFLAAEGVAAVLARGWGAGAGVIMHSDYGSPWEDDPLPPPSVALMPEHYNRIHRLLERGVKVEVEVDVDAQFYPGAEGLNVIAEIPGRGRGGEIVMLGAHFDSWHGAVGATDNGSSSAVVMEAMRILKTLDLPMRRTVRAALWGEEEPCLCGSRSYVKQHFADPVTMELKPAHAKLSTYINLDNGGGRIRGVYLQQNDMARPIWEAWMQPFADLGVNTATIINTTGTDHLSFNAVGLPGFSFVQDPLDYDLNTHHSNVDHVDHLLPGDLMQAAAVMAAAVYHAATREEMMPRKPLPEPLPPKRELPDILR